MEITDRITDQIVKAFEQGKKVSSGHGLYAGKDEPFSIFAWTVSHENPTATLYAMRDEIIKSINRDAFDEIIWRTRPCISSEVSYETKIPFIHFRSRLALRKAGQPVGIAVAIKGIMSQDEFLKLVDCYGASMKAGVFNG